MSESWLLKLFRSDGEGYVLLQALSSSESALDLNLIATEGEAPYKGKIRQRKITDLRAKNYRGGDDEWQNILTHVFNPQAATSLPDDQRKGLEVVAAVSNGNLTITLRNRIDKITQRLGSVELSQDDDAEIQLFEWCASAIDQRSMLEVEQTKMRSKHESAQATIASLEAKLEELVQAKADHEEELISRFVLLLNEKKLKIRNQQRILSTAKVDQKKLQQMQKTLEGKGRRAGSSRAGKRRADAQAEEDAEDKNDSSDAFEKMDVDKQEGIVAGSQDASSERQTTPETETATESDDGAPDRIAKASPPLKASTSSRPKKSSKSTPPAPQPSQSRQTRANKTASPPPPVRQLPFAKKGAQPAKKASETGPEPEKPRTRTETRGNTNANEKANDSGDETVSDDDEL